MLVSVVIPVGPIDGVLRKQLQRVLGQTGVELGEVVLSLNTSDAKVVEDVHSIVDRCRDDRVRIVDSADQPGAAHARNVGAAAATGSILAFCDADDLVHEGWLASLVSGLEKFDGVAGRVVAIFPEKRMERWYPLPTNGELKRFLGRPYLLSGNMAVKRTVFEAVGGFDETLTRCEDIAFSWSLERNGYSIGHVESAIIDYRHRAGVMPMLRQHYFYGRGMSEVLRRFGSPAVAGRSRSRLRGMLRANNQPVGGFSVVGSLRRFAIAAGRVRGLLR